ncbi:adenosine kinase 2-like [Histomonas meleagridis]|uniref:adenosine kinase 2-like n=1 Tax=Histomonas meleagridis TaxID=135588 RepID=UPI00355A767F|nr:adenosine kinase 2-like [Histomonas meleagridis]
MIFSIDNPLIDATAEVDESFLNKWGLKTDDAILVDESYQQLIDEIIKSEKTQKTPGGACQNVLAMAQWFMQDEGETAIVGSVGSDSNREVLESILTQCGVKCFYQEIPHHHTGCCAILVCNTNGASYRTIVTSLGASSMIDYNNWYTPEVAELFGKAKIVILANFFIRSNEKISLSIAIECLHRKIPLAIGLSSPSAIDCSTWPTLKQIFRVADVVFGNKEEIICLSKKFGLIDKNEKEENLCLKELTRMIANYDVMEGQKRIVVATNGPSPTIGCMSGCEPIEKEPADVPMSRIVDTNGAGDSFEAGFLVYYMKGYSLEKCIEAGNYCGTCNIQERGCTVPKYRPNFI